MILDTSTKLEAVLAGAVAANQPEVHVDYFDYNPSGQPTPPATFRVALNSNTDVTILAAPVANPIREPTYISIYNKDTSGVTITIKTDDGTTERIIFKKAIGAGESLQYTRQNGWYREAVV